MGRSYVYAVASGTSLPKKNWGVLLLFDFRAMNQHGIDPWAWEWFRKYAQVRIDPAPQDLAAARRIVGRTVLFAALDIAVVAMLLVAIQVLMMVRPSPYSPGFLVLVILAVGVVVLVVIIRRARAAVRRVVIQAVRWQHASRIFGEVGGVRQAAARFGQGPVEAGARGEENTAVLLGLLLYIPGTKVFHGLRFPGHDQADVDHAVTIGNTVYLIDSKFYRWGSYEWRTAGSKDVIVRSDGYGHSKTNWMYAAAQGYREMFGEGVTVRPLVMIHGWNTSVGQFGRSAHGVYMMTARDAMDVMGNAIALQAGAPDNEAVLRVLVSMLKPTVAPLHGSASQDPDGAPARKLD